MPQISPMSWVFIPFFFFFVFFVFLFSLWWCFKSPFLFMSRGSSASGVFQNLVWSW